MASDFSRLLSEVRSCRLCEPELPLGANPVLRASRTARVLIVGQAPGTRDYEPGVIGSVNGQAMSAQYYEQAVRLVRTVDNPLLVGRLDRRGDLVIAVGQTRQLGCHGISQAQRVSLVEVIEGFQVFEQICSTVGSRGPVNRLESAGNTSPPRARRAASRPAPYSGVSDSRA